MSNLKRIFIVLMILGIFFSSIPVYAEENVNGNNTSIEVTWINHYSTYDQMVEEAEIILYGRVIDQTFELREDGNVYTKNIIQVDYVHKGNVADTVTIYQLGGNVEDKGTSYPKELPLLNENISSVFMLDTSGDRIWIAGAGQGVFESIIFSNWNDVLNCCESLFRINNVSENILRSLPETPFNGYHFSPSTSRITYYVNTISQVSGAKLTSFKNGLDAWDAEIPVDLDEENTGMGPRVTVNISNTYSPSGFLGVTSYDGEYHRIITAYYKEMKDGGFDTSYYWGKLGTHEMGHALGLAHSGTTASVMYFDLLYCASELSNQDRVAIRSLYY